MGKVIKDIFIGEFSAQEIVEICKGLQIDLIIRREMETTFRALRDHWKKKIDEKKEPLPPDPNGKDYSRRLTKPEVKVALIWATNRGIENGLVTLKELKEYCMQKFPHFQPDNYGQQMFNLGKKLIASDTHWIRGKKGKGNLVYKRT